MTLRNLSKTENKNKSVFKYINQIPLNDTNAAPHVNYFECEATEIIGRKVVIKKFSWITSPKITNQNVFDLMRAGQSRWKIENETFNTLKNKGYQFEHNFGHGKKNLHTIFSSLMMLAFLIDQIQEISNGLFRTALAKSGSRRELWENNELFLF